MGHCTRLLCFVCYTASCCNISCFRDDLATLGGIDSHMLLLFNYRKIANRNWIKFPKTTRSYKTASFIIHIVHTAILKTNSEDEQNFFIH